MSSLLLDREAIVPEPELRCAAGAGRGGDIPALPVRLSAPGPDRRPGGQAEARRVQNRLTLLLEHHGLLPLVRPVWEQEGEVVYPPYAPQLGPALAAPPFLIARQCGKLVLTSWGAIYEAPPTLWREDFHSQGTGGDHAV